MVGKKLNELKNTILDLIEKKKRVLESSGIEAQLAEETIDVSLPVRPQLTGSIHPISQTIDEVTSIFGEMGFSVEEGPDIEEDCYNFTALNIPPNHPARQEHDTFYLNAEKMANVWYFVRTRARFKSALCKVPIRPYVLLFLDELTGATTMRPIHQCFTKWRDC